MIKQKFFIDFASKMIIYFFGAVVGIVVSRVAGPLVVGTVAYGYSFVSMFFFMFGLFGTSHIKLINGGERLKNCNKVYSTIIFSTFFLFILTVTIFYYIQKQIFNVNFSSEETIVIILATLVIGFQGLFKIPDITFVALTQQVKINLPKLLNAIIFNTGRLIVIFLGYKAIALVSVKLIGIISILPVYYYLLGPNFFAGKWDNNLFKKYFKIGIPILFITISISIISNYSKVLLKEYSSITELGYFSGAVGLASMFIMVGGSAGDLFFPIFSKAVAEKRIDYIRKQIYKYEHFIFRFILPFIVILSVNSNTVITFLLGDKYIKSVSIFSVLILYAFMKIWSIPFYNLINGLGKFKLNAILHIFFFLFFFSTLYLFISPKILNLGGLGLGLSLLLLEIVKLIIWYLFSNPIIKFKFNIDILKFTIFFVLVYIVSCQVYSNYFVNLNYLMRLSFIALNLLIVFLFMYFIKMIRKSDLDYIMELVNFKSLREYFKKEIKS